MRHIAISVDDFDSGYRHLREKGVTLEGEPYSNEGNRQRYGETVRSPALPEMRSTAPALPFAPLHLQSAAAFAPALMAHLAHLPAFAAQLPALTARSL